MDSIRVSEAPDSGSIPDEATYFYKYILQFAPDLSSIPYLSAGRLTRLQIFSHVFCNAFQIQVRFPAYRQTG